MQNVSVWSTKDFYSAVIIRTAGISLHNVTRDTPKTCMFHFDSDSEQCEEILRKHWNRELQLQTRLLIETINEFKTRIYTV